MRWHHVVALVALMGAAMLAGAASFHLQHEADRFPPDWHVGEVEISGKSLPEARSELQRYARAWADTIVAIEVRAPDGSVRWRGQATRQQLGAALDVEATLQQAWQQARRHSPLVQAVLRWMNRTDRVEIAPVVQVDRARVEEWLREAGKQLERAPCDARVRYLSAGRWEAIPEQRGFRLPLHAVEMLVETLQQSRTTCSLQGEEVAPRITQQHLQQIDSEWTSATTRYSERERNRAHNIRKAARAINGVVLLPGDVFSYNEVVGPRTLKEGFRRAPIIVRGELVPGDGGGVCQVSTTLYIAALQAGLQIVQRSKHAFPIGYAPPGLDATVVYGAIDLRFRNNTPSPIALVTEAKGGRMTVRVLGSSAHRRTARIERIVHAVIPAPVKTFPTSQLPEGKRKVVNKGQRGWRVSVYRVITEPGKPPLREKVGTDYYRPQARVVLVGQGASEQETPSVRLLPAASSDEGQPL
ncbi:MAG: VanW family protein [Armatimonadota bacterium]|nr:VanW family protein [Armatimonadota bacterium]